VTVRTFYWNPVVSRPLWRRWARPATVEFTHGNAGDRFNVDLLDWAYPHESIQNVDTGRRLLLVGSVAHRIATGDVVNGIGAKLPTLPSADEARVVVRGVRGPKTLRLFAEAGHDVSGLEFMGDPGLLIAHLYPEVMRVEPEPNRAIFIPHYRERGAFSSTDQYDVVDIDALPRDIATQIRQAEVVHTSSLHGLIWAHALGRPAHLVLPRTAEPAFKYEDYLASVGLPFEAHESIEVSLRATTAASPPDLTSHIAAITLPSRELLESARIIT